MSIFISQAHSRVDTILVWGHGLQHLSSIFSDIRGEDDFEILKIQKHKPKSMKRFVKEMYSFDYAPFWHLKERTKYLLKTRQEVCFIFIKNLNPNEDYLGEGSFRHKESLTLKVFKELLRDRYNPYADGIRTHNHVIHATDSQEQTAHILNYLGYSEGTSIFECENKFINLPYYIKGFNNFEFNEIDVTNLFCNVIEGDSWDNWKVKTVGVKDSPQYRGLSENIEIYAHYIKTFLGGPLQEDYNIQRYKTLYKNFEYLKEPYQNSFVIAEKVDDQYIILDGVHRACSHIIQKNKMIKICQISK